VPHQALHLVVGCPYFASAIGERVRRGQQCLWALRNANLIVPSLPQPKAHGNLLVVLLECLHHTESLWCGQDVLPRQGIGRCLFAFTAAVLFKRKADVVLSNMAGVKLFTGKHLVGDGQCQYVSRCSLCTIGAAPASRHVGLV